MSHPAPTPQQFLAELLRPAGAGAVAWCAFFPEPPTHSAPWGGELYATEEVPKVNGENAYFSIAAFKPDATSRKKEFAVGACVVLCDDVGEKATASAVVGMLGEPSYKVRTSEGNEQWGYLLDRPASDAELKPVHARLMELALCDRSGNNLVRYGRLPAGINNKRGASYPVTCVHWQPERRFSLAHISRALGTATPASASTTRHSDENLEELIIAGESLHEPLLQLSARYVLSGYPDRHVVRLLQVLMAQSAAKHTDRKRWQDRFDSINGLVRSARERFGADSEPVLEPIEFLGMSVSDMMAPVPPEQYVVPGLVPAEAFTLIAGALATFKSTLLMYLLVWRATGHDLLNLGPPGEVCVPGPGVLVFYEDRDWRIVARLQRILQHGHAHVTRTRGAAAAAQFLELAAKNIRRVPLTGKASRTIVVRIDGRVMPNEGMITEMLDGIRAFARSDVLVCLDPLRLSIVGSQNDDDGADVVVHTLNRLAAEIPGGGWVVCSHTTKAQAKESGEGYADAAYATAGSALYSQHARSNFFVARVPVKELDKLFSPEVLPADEAVLQPVAKLTHGRLSHGPEARSVYVRMRGGILLPIEVQGTVSVDDKIKRAAPVITGAVHRLQAKGVRASATAIINDDQVKALGGIHKIRALIQLLEENGYLLFHGETKDRTCVVTPKGEQTLGEIDA